MYCPAMQAMLNSTNERDSAVIGRWLKLTIPPWYAALYNTLSAMTLASILLVNLHFNYGGLDQRTSECCK